MTQNATISSSENLEKFETSIAGLQAQETILNTISVLQTLVITLKGTEEQVMRKVEMFLDIFKLICECPQNAVRLSVIDISN
jgi:hypothetical protein